VGTCWSSLSAQSEGRAPQSGPRRSALPVTANDMAQRRRMLAWAGESHYYTEPKRLAKLGYLEARKEPGKTRERTVYALTDRGWTRSASTRAHPCPSRR
jgi:hypothetical protein